MLCRCEFHVLLVSSMDDRLTVLLFATLSSKTWELPANRRNYCLPLPSLLLCQRIKSEKRGDDCKNSLAKCLEFKTKRMDEPWLGAFVKNRGTIARILLTKRLEFKIERMDKNHGWFGGCVCKNRRLLKRN